MTFDLSPGSLLGLALWWIFLFAILYFVIRLGVRHAIQDADRRRSSERPRSF